MATRDRLKKHEHFRKLANGLDIDAKKKKNDDLICHNIASQTPTYFVTPNI